MIERLRWNEKQLRRDLRIATHAFKKERMEEPLGQYLNVFDQFRGSVEELFNITNDLLRFDEKAHEVLVLERLLTAFRYLAGPPVSADDLKVIADASLSPHVLRSDPVMRLRIIETVKLGLDKRRFRWVAEGRNPTESEREAAIVASAALIASNRVQTERRNEGKNRQETMVAQALLRVGFKQVATRAIPTLSAAPGKGEFCRESILGTRKADFVIRLWDDRVMPVECKVSNSSTNSVKRLNNDAAAKAEAWRKDFGERQVVPTAVLSGVYKLNNLLDAQTRSLMLVWAHDLGKLTKWIESTETRA